MTGQYQGNIREAENTSFIANKGEYLESIPIMCHQR